MFWFSFNLFDCDRISVLLLVNLNRVPLPPFPKIWTRTVFPPKMWRDFF